MTTLRDKLRDVIEEYHKEDEEYPPDPQVLLENIMDEIKVYFEIITR